MTLARKRERHCERSEAISCRSCMRVRRGIASSRYALLAMTPSSR
jgi:hypothetical protein